MEAFRASLQSWQKLFSVLLKCMTNFILTILMKNHTIWFLSCLVSVIELPNVFYDFSSFSNFSWAIFNFKHPLHLNPLPTKEFPSIHCILIVSVLGVHNPINSLMHYSGLNTIYHILVLRNNCYRVLDFFFKIIWFKIFGFLKTRNLQIINFINI